MLVTQDVHRQFADFFNDQTLEPWLYLLSKRLGEGSICLDVSEVDEKEVREAGFEGSLSPEVLEENPLVSKEGWTPFIYSGSRLYLQRYYQYETAVLKSIQTMTGSDDDGDQLLEGENGFVQSLFPENPKIGVDWQLMAALMATRQRFTIITGGPGTGKTTTIAKILALLFKFKPDLRVALTAPTGKAAARMKESLENSVAGNPLLSFDLERLIPSTIHRLLGWVKDSIYFKHNATNTVPFDLVIVDESSMIDMALFSKLMDAIGERTKVILLGDKNQLASVEAGSLFGDLCATQSQPNLFPQKVITAFNGLVSNPFSKIGKEAIQNTGNVLLGHIVELQHSFRFSDEGGIGRLSRAVIQNQEDSLKTFFENWDEQVTIDFHYKEEVLEDFALGYREYIEEKDLKKAFEKLNQLRILCAVREGEQGLYAVNQKVENILKNKKVLFPVGGFYENRPVIITSNNYELGLFNGDVGITRKDEAGILKVWFEQADGSLKGILPAFIDHAETVFAMTIHKSQGSEFSRVLVILPDTPETLILTRELLYTAVTRAKTKVFIQGDQKTILTCVEKQVQRGSGIRDRILESQK